MGSNLVRCLYVSDVYRQVVTCVSLELVYFGRNPALLGG